LSLRPPSALTPQKAPLIPKLRGYVAEFLHERSLERLRIFISPTCVGFSTGNQLVRQWLFLSVLPGTSESYMPSALRHAHRLAGRSLSSQRRTDINRRGWCWNINLPSIVYAS